MARTPDNCDYASVSVTSAKRYGIWPCGLWTLAVWRCLICAASRLGVGGYQDRMVCNLSSPRLLQPVTGALEGDLGGLAAAVYPTGLCLSPCLLSSPRGRSGP